MSVLGFVVSLKLYFFIHIPKMLFLNDFRSVRTISIYVCDAFMYLCPFDSWRMFAVVFTGFQSKYQRVPAEKALQAVDLSSLRDSLP